MLGFIILLLIGSPSEAGFPLAIHGARARWDSSAEIAYRPESWLSLGQLKVEALHLESGRRLPFTVRSQAGREWRLSPGEGWEALEDWVREPYVLTVSDYSGRELDRTYFQLGGLLDGIYQYDGCLGACFEGGGLVLRVWAPSARSVSLVWPRERDVSIPMQKAAGGVWEARGNTSWKGRPYLYEVEVFTPASGRMERHRVTDPYSIALGTNSVHSLVFDPRDPAWMHPGWNSHRRPVLQNRNDAVLYELHIREFSQSDTTVPERYRGLYKAFTLNGTAGDKHLRDLAGAGITHIHLLPVQDFTSVEEVPSARRDPNMPGSLPPDSPVPQQELSRLRTLDSFNWGYDPYHFLAPEVSYALELDGPARVREFREMVMALHQKGLRVVLDVVFNHTLASGLSRESVLDKIVPGYYYRLNEEGAVLNSSCCSDTASERRMMEKLMRDSLESWRRHFQVDGFRFDLMNLHGVGTMQRIRDDLWKKDPSLLIYGEAWPFGSLLDRAPGDAFTQGRVYGNSIAVFNDRIRDALRGGTTDTKEKSDQGFVTGLFYDFNHEPANRNTPVDLGAQREKLLYLTDVVRVGMAGNLRDYRFRGYRGDWTTGGSLSFHGGPTGFSAGPGETIN